MPLFAFRWRVDDGLPLNAGLLALRMFRGCGPVLPETLSPTGSVHDMHLPSLASVFAIRFLDRIMTPLTTGILSIF